MRKLLFWDLGVKTLKIDSKLGFLSFMENRNMTRFKVCGCFTSAENCFKKLFVFLLLLLLFLLLLVLFCFVFVFFRNSFLGFLAETISSYVEIEIMFFLALN